jgi:glycosyltransferase involved in cell wall biosynthesis
MTGDSHKPALRMLYISPLFAPTADSEAFCSAKLVQALGERGVSVTVLASSDARKGACIDSSRLWDSVRDVALDVPQFSEPDALRSILAATRFQTPAFAGWVDAVVATAGRLHRKAGFDLVYTRSLPTIAHIAGFWCARQLRLPWVANINDPWKFNFLPGVNFPEFSSFKARAYLFWLRRTLRNASLVTYPCRRLRDFHTKLAKLDYAAEIIPHIGSRPEHATRNPNGHFCLVHAGKLGTRELTQRPSKALLAGLKAFIDTSAEAAALTRLVLVGPKDEETQSLISELGLERNVQTVGRVNYEDSLDYIASASACILIEACVNEGIFLPSKLSDYFACGKPVLALSPRIGTAADLADRGELIRVDHDPDAVRNAIAEFYSEFKQGTLSARSPSDRLVAQLSGPSVAEKFLSACQAFVPRPQTEGLRARFSTGTQAGSPVEQPF